MNDDIYGPLQDMFSVVKHSTNKVGEFINLETSKGNLDIRKSEISLYERL